MAEEHAGAPPASNSFAFLQNAMNTVKQEMGNSTQKLDSAADTTEGTPKVTSETAPEAEASAEETVEAGAEDSKASEGSGETQATGLEEIPEAQRKRYDELYSKAKKAADAAFTKRMQEIAAQKSKYTAIESFMTERKLSIDQLPKVVSEALTLIEEIKKPGTRLMRGTKVLSDVPDESGVDFDELSDREQKLYRHFDNRVEQVKKAAESEVAKVKEPLLAEKTLQDNQKKLGAWAIAQHKAGITPDVIQQAVILANEFEVKHRLEFGPEFFDALDSNMEDFIITAEAKLSKAKLAGKKKAAVPPETELPNSSSQAPSKYSGKDLMKAFNATKAELGLQSRN